MSAKQRPRAVDRRALTKTLVGKIIIERHPSKIDKDGRRHYLICAIPYQNPQQGLSGSRRCARLGSRSSPSLSGGSVTEAERHLIWCTAEVQLMGARNGEDRVFWNAARPRRALPAGGDLTACTRARPDRNLHSG